LTIIVGVVSDFRGVVDNGFSGHEDTLVIECELVLDGFLEIIKTVKSFEVGEFREFLWSSGHIGAVVGIDIDDVGKVLVEIDGGGEIGVELGFELEGAHCGCV